MEPSLLEQEQYLIETLLQERGLRRPIPGEETPRRMLLRALFNTRMPSPPPEGFLPVQNAYLQRRIAEKGITDIDTLQPVQPGVYLWKGDITTLHVDAIVNAANASLLGCFVPNHACIDNAIHTFAGVQLRQFCAQMMQRRQAATGSAYLTPAFNLPSRYVLHTVGPIISGKVLPQDQNALQRCYRSCLQEAEKKGLSSVAFCCISTGEFHYPREEAALLALRTVQEFLQTSQTVSRVIFNVFTQEDYQIYARLLGVQ